MAPSCTMTAKDSADAMKAQGITFLPYSIEYLAWMWNEAIEASRRKSAISEKIEREGKR